MLLSVCPVMQRQDSRCSLGIPGARPMVEVAPVTGLGHYDGSILPCFERVRVWKAGSPRQRPGDQNYVDSQKYHNSLSALMWLRGNNRVVWRGGASWVISLA